MIISIATTYHLTIGIVEVTNDLHNTLNYYSDRETIVCPIRYLSCFKLLFPNIRIEPSPYGHYVIDICH